MDKKVFNTTTADCLKPGPKQPVLVLTAPVNVKRNTCFLALQCGFFKVSKLIAALWLQGPNCGVSKKFSTFHSPPVEKQRPHTPPFCPALPTQKTARGHQKARQNRAAIRYRRTRCFLQYFVLRPLFSTKQGRPVENFLLQQTALFLGFYRPVLQGGFCYFTAVARVDRRGGCRLAQHNQTVLFAAGQICTAQLYQAAAQLCNGGQRLLQFLLRGFAFHRNKIAAHPHQR